MALLDLVCHALSILNDEDIVTDICCYFVTDEPLDEVGVQVTFMLSQNACLCITVVIIFTMYRLRIALSLLTE